MSIKKEERHKVAKAQSGKGKEKNFMSLCFCAFVPTKRGFTLMELMAVVAIIMILAAIIMPNVAGNIERGRVGKATADIDILVKAVNFFQIDHGELPGSLDDLWNATGGGPYISTNKVDSLKTPWSGSYSISKGTGYYTITATGKTPEDVKLSKTITFGNTD